jgi:hypothetical protein
MKESRLSAYHLQRTPALVMCSAALEGWSRASGHRSRTAWVREKGRHPEPTPLHSEDLYTRSRIISWKGCDTKFKFRNLHSYWNVTVLWLHVTKDFFRTDNDRCSPSTALDFTPGKGKSSPMEQGKKSYCLLIWQMVIAVGIRTVTPQHRWELFMC